MNTLTLRDGPYLATTLAGCGDPPLLANLQLWFKADAGVKYGGVAVVDGGYVDQWENQAGTGLGTDALNAVSDATRPTLQTNELNGLPILRFDGSNDYLQLANNADVDITQDLTFFCVFKAASVVDYNMMLTKGTNSLDMQYEFRVDAAGLDYLTFGAAGVFRNGGTSVHSGHWHRLSAYNNCNPGSVSRTYIDNAQQSTGSRLTVSAKATVAYFGKRYDSGVGSLMLNGDVAEWGLYNAWLDTADRALLDDYLTCKYGL